MRASMAIIGGILSVALVSGAHADEFGFSSYGLGGSAFGAGATPPPGTYISFVSGYYEGKIGTPVTIGGVTLNVGSRLQFFQEALNGLYVPEQKLLGGNLGFSVTVPVGHIDIRAAITGPLGNDPPPMKWSDSKYGFLPEEDRYGEEEIQGGRDRCEATPSGRSGVARDQGPGRRSVNWGDGCHVLPLAA